MASSVGVLSSINFLKLINVLSEFEIRRDQLVFLVIHIEFGHQAEITLTSLHY